MLQAGPELVAKVSSFLFTHLSFEIPELCTFTNFVKEAVKTGIVSSRARTEIIQVLRTYITAKTVRPTSEQYTTVCRKLISKFPTLKDTEGNSRIVSKGNYNYSLTVSCFRDHGNWLCATHSRIFGDIMMRNLRMKR